MNVDWYVYKSAWESDPDSVRAAAINTEANPNLPTMRIVSETMTCPVPGVDDPEVACLHFELEPVGS